MSKFVTLRKKWLSVFLTFSQTVPNPFYGNVQVHVSCAIDRQRFVGNTVGNGRWMYANRQTDCHENSYDNNLHFEWLVWRHRTLNFESRSTSLQWCCLRKSVFFNILEWNVLEGTANAFINCNVLKIIIMKFFFGGLIILETTVYRSSRHVSHPARMHKVHVIALRGFSDLGRSLRPVFCFLCRLFTFCY